VISRALIDKHAVLPTVEDFERFLENDVWVDSKPSIVRLHNVYDVVGYYGDNINDNIRGLGFVFSNFISQLYRSEPKIWQCRHPNPVHTIRVCWNSSGEEAIIKYKLHDLEAEWHPKKIYDMRLKRWVADPNMEGWAGVLLSMPDSIVPNLITEDWNFMGVKHAINDIPSMSRAGLRSWERYWSVVINSPIQASLPWSLSSITPFTEIQSEEPISQETSTQVANEGELLVVGGPSATGWERSRKKKSKYLAEGDVLVYEPNADDIESDAAFDYFLPLSFARVDSVEFPQAQVTWLFAEHFDTEFIPWASRTQSIDVNHFVKDASGRFVKVHLDEETLTLTPSSILDVRNLLSPEDFEQHTRSMQDKAAGIAKKRQRKPRKQRN
jgi:hypothetical protein